MPLFDPGFSEASYGFRPGRSAHAAVKAARAHVAGGRRVVVDLDLEKFFDRVNHDVAMSRLARRIGDKRLPGIIRRFLQAGMPANGVCVARQEGTPQGGPLSPLIANLLLDDLDCELESRGHSLSAAIAINLATKARHCLKVILLRAITQLDILCSDHPSH